VPRHHRTGHLSDTTPTNSHPSSLILFSYTYCFNSPLQHAHSLSSRSATPSLPVSNISQINISVNFGNWAHNRVGHTAEVEGAGERVEIWDLFQTAMGLTVAVSLGQYNT
jgi:hypothetical protein